MVYNISLVSLDLTNFNSKYRQHLAFTSSTTCRPPLSSNLCVS